MGSSVYSTAVAANNTLYVVNRDHLFAPFARRRPVSLE